MKPFIGALAEEAFFRDYWRQKPLFVSGGARQLVRQGLRQAQLWKAVVELERLDPSAIKRSGEDVVFVQNLDRSIPSLQRAARRMARIFSCPSVWFDAVLAEDTHSIGCHYDHSDNFVLQQSGTKIWNLHAPDIIPTSELRDRILNKPGIGAMYMPDDHLEFRLEAGDLLYIPLFWPHQGISEGHSLSLSLVCNATNGATELLPLLRQLLTERPAWWRPLPNLNVDTEAGQRQLSALVRDLLAEVGNPSFQAELGGTWASERRLMVRGGESSAATLDEPAKVEVSVDQQKLERIFDQPGPVLDLARLVLPEAASGENRLLRQQLGRVYLRRFLIAQVESLRLVSDPKVAVHLENCLSLFQQLSVDAMLEAVVRPEVTSWCHRALEAARFRYPPRVEEIAGHLGNFILPWLIRDHIQSADRPLRLAASTDDSVQLFALGRELKFASGVDKGLEARVAKSAVNVTASDGQSWSLPIDALTAEVASRSDPTVSEMTRLNEGTVLVCTRSSWYEAFLPRGGQFRSSQPYWEIDASETEYFVQCFEEGAALIRACWPEAWDELSESISLLMPLRADGMKPHNESIPAFRGMIRSSARPSYRAAQTLVHETAHNKFNSILDIFSLVENDPREEYPSPFVDAPRSIVGILHGVFAFINDAHVSMSMLEQVDISERAVIQDYVADLARKIGVALDVLENHAKLTGHGERLMEGFLRANQALRH